MSEDGFTESVVEDTALVGVGGLKAAVSAENATTRLLGQYAENASCSFEKGKRFQTGGSSMFAINAIELQKRFGNHRELLGC